MRARPWHRVFSDLQQFLLFALFNGSLINIVLLLHANHIIQCVVYATLSLAGLISSVSHWYTIVPCRTQFNWWK